jgi:heterodisulfide reductase subunit A
MGVARARLLEPLEEIKVNVTPVSLVIGGGIAGMNAALNLADQGFEVHLVEKENQLGGILQHLNKLFPTNEEASKLIDGFIQKVKSHDKIDIHLGTKVEEVRGFIGNFDVTLDHKAKQDSLKVGTIIVATGAEELKPGGQYGYGRLPNVITQQELELQMKNGTFDGQNVVMINCVGARVAERTYCSRFCCMTAIKNALLIKENNHQARVWILHRDIMSYGVEFEDYYRRSMKEGVRYIRYDIEKPPQVVGGERCEKIKVWHQLMGRDIDLPIDTLVLTTPLIPHTDNEQISKMLKVPLSEQGFFLEAHLKLMPVEFATDGIFICGSARWPSEVAECISQAYAAASKASIPMKAGYVKPEAITSSVNEDECSGCGICEPLCPYNAIEFIVKGEKRVAHCNEGLCKGCGTCGASCPAGAITMKHFTSAEIMAQLEALFTS